MRSKLAIVLGFHACWLACVMGAARGSWLVGVACATVFVGCVLGFSQERAHVLRVLMAALMLGVLVDSVLVVAGACIPKIGWPGLPWLTPPWMLALWAMFSVMFVTCMCWLETRPALALLLGAVGGPMSYFAGERLGAVSLAPGWLGIPTVSLAWALAMPLLALASRRLRLPARPDPAASPTPSR